MMGQRTKTPAATVVMPAYNAEKYIEKAVRSVMEQTVSDWELIIVDDCSKDGTYAVAGRLAAEDPRIRLIRNETNLGVARTRNRALELSRGKYVAFLDADDMWYPEKLEKQMLLLTQKMADLSYTSYRLVVPPKKDITSDYIVPEEISFEDMLCQNRIGYSTVVMTRALADRYRFTTEYYHEDYVLWLQMLQQGVKMAGLPEILVEYCYYPTSKAGNKYTSAKYRWIIYRRFLGLPLLKSAGYLARYAVAGVKKYRKVSG